MKKVILILIISIFFINDNYAQENNISNKDRRKIEKAEQKKLKEEKVKEMKEAFFAMADDSSFIVEAYSIMADNRRTFQVSPNTNFFKIDGDEFVLQTSNPFQIGYNGLGGVTIQGRITEYEVKKGKDNESITVNASLISTVTGHSNIYISIRSDGSSTARLRDNFGNTLTYYGKAISLEESSAFEGNRIF